MTPNRLFHRAIVLAIISILPLMPIFSQMSVPRPPEISSGADASRFRVKAPSLFLDEPITQVTSASNVINAIDFATDGSNNGGFLHIPPDPHGAVGLNHVVNVVNTSLEWYTKAGTIQNSQSLQSFFSSPTNTFDPKVLYDQYSDRFLVVTMEVDGRDDMNTGNDVSTIYIAVSKTADPNSGWWKASYSAVTMISGNNTWADYPGFAIDEEAIYVAANMFAFNGEPFGTDPDFTSFGGVRLWIIPKSGIYSGGALGQSIYDPYSGGGIAVTTQPAHTFGTTPTGLGTYLIGYNGISDGTNEFIQSIRVDNPLSAPTFNLSYVGLGDLETNPMPVPDAPQMGSATLIDAGDSRALNAVWRDGKIALCFTYNSGGEATAHWVLLTASGGAPGFSDQGDVGGEDVATGAHTFYPSVALNQNGDLGIGFALSAPTLYAGAYYTGRASGDASGMTDPVKVLKAGVAPYVRTFGGTRNRWGDYSATVVDPSDDVSFWVYNEYAMTQGTMTMMPNEDGRWATAYGKFQIGDCPDMLPLAGTIAAGTYTANTINATGLINAPSMVTFDAMNTELNPTFTVNLGATLETLSNGCP
ncbi:MAG: hypothetical protein KDC80_26925 [Saprospiraceae bacterium]|nr:hypothetical protein [Saprospiraceae bacterium]